MQKTVTNHFMRSRVMATGLMVLLGVGIAAPGMAQDSLPTPSPVPQPTPIPASDIPSRAAEAADAARQAVANSAPDARLQQIQQDLPDEQARIEELRETTEKELKMPGPASMIKEGEKSWVRAQARLDRWLVDLSARSSAFDGTLDD